MDFVVENVSIDSFYLNLLLGIPKVLDKHQRIGVRKQHLSRFPAVTHSDICAFEQKHSILLPEDLRSFYSSTDGFYFRWVCSFGMHQLSIAGKIEINSLDKFIHLTGLLTKSDPGVQLEGNRYILSLGPNSKVFELCVLDDGTKVALVYINTRFVPTVWLYTSQHEFYYLADNFTTYFRMAVAHLGFPNWQLLYTSKGVPEWTRILMRLIAPRLLLQNKRANTIEMVRKERSRKTLDKYANALVNKLDGNVFKYQPRPLRNAATVVTRGEITPSPTKSPQKKKYHWVKSRYLRRPSHHNAIRSRNMK